MKSNQKVWLAVLTAAICFTALLYEGVPRRGLGYRLRIPSLMSWRNYRYYTQNRHGGVNCTP